MSIEQEETQFPTGKFDRSKIIAKTGLKIGTNYAKFHLKKALGKNRNPESRKELHRNNASELFREFSKLRGTALKLAQGMSLDSTMLPEEFAEVLTQAQYSVPPINRTLVRRIIKEELGDWPENVFASFDEQASAAASLGQVHKATSHTGQKLAVKIQYPNVRDTIKSDLAMARVLFERMVKSKKADEYFGEVRERLLEETDYMNEGEQIKAFHKRYANDRITTPEWVEELSTGKVLSMTWLDGRHLKEFLQEKPSQKEKNHFGQLLWDFFHEQINDSYTVHADAHPGNYLFMNDGRLGVLDFGCVKVCPADFFRNYMNLFTAHRDGDITKIKELYVDLEILNDAEKLSDYEIRFFEYSLRLGKLFVSPYDSDFFDFGNKEFFDGFNTFGKEASEFKEPRGSEHFIYVTKAHIGMYQILMKLGATIDIRPGRERLYRFLDKLDI